MIAELPKDDAYDDAMAAYREVSGKSSGSETAPQSEMPPVSQTPTSETEEDAPARRSDIEEQGSDDNSRRLYPQRAKDGKFAKAATTEAKTETPVEPTADADKLTAAKPDEGVEPPATPQAPPASWSVKAKAAWDQLPEDIKAEVAKRETETAQGLSALRDYKDLKPYADLARQHGTTINKALERYVGLENTLRQDPVRGIGVILQDMGMSQQQAVQFIGEFGKRYGGTQPQTQKQQNVFENPNNDPLIEMLRPVMEPMMSKINALDNRFMDHSNAQQAERSRAAQTAQIETLSKALQDFAGNPTNRYFPDLEETMTRLFETKMVPLTGNHAADIKAAYETAAQMHPEVREALIEQRLQEARTAERKREQEAANKAKLASRSITGSRVPGTVVREQQEHTGHDDIEAEVRRAYHASIRA